MLEVLLDGQTAPDSPWHVLAVAGLGTVASGLVGGYVAAWLGGGRPLRHALAVVAFLCVDGVYVLVKNIGGHPLSYELAGALTLILATVAGGWLRSRQADRGRRLAGG